jgi:hypothetical protein
MANTFVGDNDHGDAVPPTDVLLQMITTLREDVVHFANELNEVTTQRDYARREVCWLLSEQSVNTISAQSFAVDRKWDCFKEEKTNV